MSTEQMRTGDGSKAEVKRVVLTGGPCAGKTTALARLADWFGGIGWRTLCVPEAATMLIQGGVTPSDVHPLVFQEALLRLQMRVEDAFLGLGAEFAAKGQDVLLLCDRGTMDSAAYLEADVWRATLDSANWSVVDLRDRRYDGVVHMTTAADGAEHAYTTANNAARRETPEQARELDRRTMAAWVGHPHLRVVGNEAGFDFKVRSVVSAVSRIVGVPEPLEAERKFVVSSVDEIPVRHETVEIEQTYLTGGPGTERVRRRGQHGSSVYYHTVKTPTGRPGERVETERQVSPREYVTLLGRADPARHVVRKTRTCFLWGGRYYELDKFVSPREGLALLEVEVDDPSDTDVRVPPFVHVDRDVTDDPAWTNSSIALKAGGP